MSNYIHPTAVIGEDVILGDGNYIGPFCIIGYPAEHKSYWGWIKDVKGTRRCPTWGRVIIGDNNIFTGHVTIDASTKDSTGTFIGDNCFFMKHSHVGHDAYISSDTTVSCGAKIGGHCIIGTKVNIGLNATIHQRVEVQEGCMIGMGAVVTKTLKTEPYSKYVGNPARYLGINIPR